MAKSFLITLTSFLILLLMCTTFSMPVLAQQAHNPEMADAFRADGKIYVVVLVLATIFAGIIFYLLVLDRKIARLERENPVT